MIGLGLRSFFFNVGWYLGTTIIAIVGSPILLMPRRFVVAWSLFWIDFCLWWLQITCRLTHRVSGLARRRHSKPLGVLRSADPRARPMSIPLRCKLGRRHRGRMGNMRVSHERESVLELTAAVERPG